MSSCVSWSKNYSFCGKQRVILYTPGTFQHKTLCILPSLSLECPYPRYLHHALPSSYLRFSVRFFYFFFHDPIQKYNHSRILYSQSQLYFFPHSFYHLKYYIITYLFGLFYVSPPPNIQSIIEEILVYFVHSNIPVFNTVHDT